MARRPNHPARNKPPEKNRRDLRSLHKAADWAVYEPPNASELKVARVYINYGIESGVNLDGDLIRLKNRRQLLTVPGDLVYTDGITVEGILPRGKVLARYADEGGVRLIASHLDQVGLVVSASTPPMHEGFVDRYLVFCRIVELPLFIILNKMDEPEEGVEARLDPFKKADVDIYRISATTGKGLSRLVKRLEKGITVLSGLSGVGKSTLSNAILDEDIPTDEVSLVTKKGRHTTSAGEAYEIDEKSLVIDTPGIKKFGFIGIAKTEIIKGFPEFLPFASSCDFDNCLHVREKGCGILAALEEGKIDERRHHAYCEMIRTMEDAGE